MAGDTERLASPRRDSRLSRRVLLAGTVGAAGALALADRAGTQGLPPAVPDDPTKVPGPPPAPVGMRSPFEHPARLTPAPVPAFTPLDTLAERILSEQQLHTIVALEPRRRNRALLRLLYVGGLRASELCALKWRDLQPQDGAGQVRAG
jgi:integrase